MTNMLESKGYLLETHSETKEMMSAVPFENNLAYIEARQQEYLLMLEIAGLKQKLFRFSKASGTKHVVNEKDSPLDIGQLREKINVLDAKRQQYINTNRERENNSSDIDIPFVQLRERTRINSLDEDVLWLIYLKAVSPDFYQLYEDSGFNTYGRENRGEIRIGNLLQIVLPNLFGEQMKAIKRFHKASPLVACHLIDFYGDIDDCESIQGVEVNLPLRLINWISGLPEDILAPGRFRIENPTDKLENVILPDAYKNNLQSLLERYDEYVDKCKKLGMDELITYGRSVVVLEYGPPGTGKTMLARAMSHQLGRPLISLRKNKDSRSRYSQNDDGLVARLFREAKLQNGIVFLDECEVLCAENGESISELLYELENNDVIVIMATNKPERMAKALDRRISLKLSFNIPDAPSRLKIWQTLIPNGVTLHPKVDLEILAAKYCIAGGYIKNAVLMAVKAAVNSCENDEKIVLEQGDLENAAREQEMHVGGINLYRTIVKPRHTIGKCLVSEDNRKRLKEISTLAEGHRLLKLKQEKIRPDENFNRGGFNILLYGHEYAIAIQAAHGIAKELGVNLETVMLEDLLKEKKSSSDDPDLISFNLEHLFENVSGTGNLLVICDSSGLIGDKEKGTSFSRIERILNEFEGIKLVVTSTNKIVDLKVQKMFHQSVLFGKPGTDLLRKYWERALAPLIPCSGGIDYDQLAEMGSFSYEQVYRIVYLAILKAFTNMDNGFELETKHIIKAAESFRSGLSTNAPIFGADK